jgi:hypothetical protein
MKTIATVHCHGFTEHDRTVIKSLLRSCGDQPGATWRYADTDSADLVLVDCDNLLAVRDAERGYLQAKRLIACSAQGASCPGAHQQLRKPLRPTQVLKLLTGLDLSEEQPAPEVPVMRGPAEPLMMFPVMI